ncbi:uncharacterized protein LOC115224005 isoform X1 [Octopus sinensis]|uniref:Uncharacterized protein LOC115224005 isoform X1 n=1 Tax=Octopus sinensis TaxID=2607531 RepID=A0A7E6FLX8_9MOLL|nr:uncharacterized protein LOC115224005 isoform X1 [Octopus sinensis]XP_036368695.1 uncharacterized protein LOC115224005 isoform X1 [Octopus sinensis]
MAAIDPRHLDEEKNSSESTAHDFSSAASQVKEKENQEIGHKTEECEENSDAHENDEEEEQQEAKNVKRNTGIEPCTSQWCRKFKYAILCIISIVFLLIVITLIMAVANHTQIKKTQHVKPLPLHPATSSPPQPPSQSHHAFLYLKTSGYTDPDGNTDLEWKKDESQDEGNIKLLNETYILIPQSGMYEINFAVHMYIPKGSPESNVTLMLKRKDDGRSSVFMERSLSSLNIVEHGVIQSLFKYKFNTNDTIFLQMNMVKFISPNMFSSYFIINNLHKNNH